MHWLSVMSNMPLSEQCSWFVLSTHPHREAWALENLSRQQFNVYCPMIVKRVRHARRTYDALRPFFPGYIFVEHHPAACVRSCATA
jgi:transcriptional antiterminator RfaH